MPFPDSGEAACIDLRTDSLEVAVEARTLSESSRRFAAATSVAPHVRAGARRALAGLHRRANLLPGQAMAGSAECASQAYLKCPGGGHCVPPCEL